MYSGPIVEDKGDSGIDAALAYFVRTASSMAAQFVGD
jgi:hypothetical protein